MRTHNKACHVFRMVSGHVWGRVTRAHKVDVNLKEVGITADIVADILWETKRLGGHIGAFVRESYDESTWGGDMDVFIEVAEDEYVWFALQAKLLKVGNFYDTIYKNDVTIQQWEKLEKLEQVGGCKAYYLFYNGNNNWTISRDSCGEKTISRHYGCSLVELTVIKDIVVNQGIKKPKFGDFHPRLAQPWRILTCCGISHNLRKYTLKQVKASKKTLYNSLSSFPKMENLDISEGEIMDNPITRANENVGWKPEVSFVIPLETLKK